MPIYDVYCPECGLIKEDVAMGIDAEKYRTQCDCGFFGDFSRVCNGGLNSRYRFCDWPDNPDFYKGQVKAGAVSVGGNVEIDNGNPRREERREKIYYNQRKQRGTETLTFDQKG